MTRGLDLDVPLKPSGVEWLGDVPEHWEVARLAEIPPHCVNGFPFDSELFDPSNGIPLVRNQVTCSKSKTGGEVVW